VKSASLKEGMKHGKRKHHGKGYAGDWKNISFNRTVVLMPNETYNLKLITGSYPQIHHNKSIKTESGMIKCKEFKDVNGIKHEWIPAIKLLT